MDLGECFIRIPRGQINFSITPVLLAVITIQKWRPNNTDLICHRSSYPRSAGWSSL